MRRLLIPMVLTGMALTSNTLAATPRLFEPTALSGEVGQSLRDHMSDVVLLAPREAVTVKDGVTTMPENIGSGLCRDQRFARQRGVGTACSGVLVSAGLVLTAAHCLNARPIERWLVVFGHDGDEHTPIRAVGIRAVRHRMADSERGDIVALELDEPVVPRADVRTGAPVEEGRVHMLGHPFGFTLKASTCAVDSTCPTIPRATQVGRDWFLADLDGFQGNSGSPVYAEDGSTLIGIWSGAPSTLVPERQVSTSGCLVYPARPSVYWGGKVTRVDGFMAEIAAQAETVAKCRSILDSH